MDRQVALGGIGDTHEAFADRFLPSRKIRYEITQAPQLGLPRDGVIRVRAGRSTTHHGCGRPGISCGPM